MTGRVPALVAMIAARLEQAIGASADALSLQDGDDLNHLSAGFVEAGSAWLASARDAERWVQVNAGFDPKDPRPGLALMSGPLLDRVRDWRRGGILEGFHFVFKRPGVRIRFLGASGSFDDALDALCSALEREGSLLAPCRGRYDPERHQFGGVLGLRAAHAFFTPESIAVMGYWRLVDRGEATIGRYEFSLALLDLFFRAVTEDEWELWDVWVQMALTGRAMPPAEMERHRDGLATGAKLLGHLRKNDAGLAWMPEAERVLLLAYRDAVPALVERWRSLHLGGALLFPLREILPFLAVFHFNRMGFALHEQQFLSAMMEALLSPKLSGPRRPPAA